MSNKVTPVPEGYNTVTPYLVHKQSAEAIKFYEKAFGAEEIMRMPGPGGMIMHAEIKIGSSVVMLSDEFKETGSFAPDPEQGTHVSMFLYVEDVDKAFELAKASGCKVVMELDDMFWGDRFGRVKDPYGYVWGMASRKEILTKEEILKRQEEHFKQMAHSK